MNKILYILFIMSLLSCETLIDDLPLSRFPELKSKLVLTSFISPYDTVINVKLSQSIPLFGEYPKPKTEKVVGFNGDSITVLNYNDDYVIPNADVVISDGKKSITIPYNQLTRYYSISADQFKIEAGKTYTLSAKTKDEFVEATTTVPLEYIQIDNLNIDSTFEKSNQWEANANGQIQPSEKMVKVLNLEFNWKDIPQTKNYYKIEAYIETVIEILTVENNKIVTNIYQPKFLTNWGGRDYSPKKRYLTDENLDGKSINSPIGKIYIYPFENNTGKTINGVFYQSEVIGPKILTVKLLNANKDFYQNQLSLENVNYNGGGNPFVEPIQVYSNVKNGLGCFGAFNSTFYVKNLD
jgi:Domain of unknown function (DUF4249)